MKTTTEGFQVPYSPSWVDRLVAWIERLPGPAWFFYSSAFLIMVLIVNATFWIAGSKPVGSGDAVNAAYALFIIYWLALYHFLTRAASRSLRVFRPLLEVDETEIVRIDYELTTLPRWVGWLAVPVGVVMSLTTILGDPAPYGEGVQATALLYMLDIPTTAFLGSTFFALLIRSIRQLRMVSRLHARATKINLLRLEPAHAFSALTARTGIGIIFLVLVGFAVEILEGGSPQGPGWAVVISLIAIAIFVLPILGIKRHIEEEKERALTEVTDLLQVVTKRLHSMVRNDEEDGLKRADTASEALMRERELLKKVPTWPWDPGTLRGFSSALLLPIFLWLVTRLLERFFS